MLPRKRRRTTLARAEVKRAQVLSERARFATGVALLGFFPAFSALLAVHVGRPVYLSSLYALGMAGFMLVVSRVQDEHSRTHPTTIELLRRSPRRAALRIGSIFLLTLLLPIGLDAGAARGWWPQ